MTEWWTYRPSDFLLFSPRTYERLLQAYNADLWPLAHALAAAAGLLALWLAHRRPAWGGTALAALMCVAWCWCAWAFHAQRYAHINWAATWFAVGFGLQGLLLAACALRHPALRASAAASAGLALVLVVFPLVTLQMAGLFPDPTALATLLLLPVLPPWWRWVLAPLPLAWCAVAAATAWLLANA